MAAAACRAVCLCAHVCLNVFHRFREVVGVTGGGRDLFGGAEEARKREGVLCRNKKEGEYRNL